MHQPIPEPSCLEIGQRCGFQNYSYQSQSAADLTNGWSLIGVLTPALSDEIRKIDLAFNRLRKHWAIPVQDRKNDVAFAFLLVKWLLLRCMSTTWEFRHHLVKVSQGHNYQTSINKPSTGMRVFSCTVFRPALEVMTIEARDVRGGESGRRLVVERHCGWLVDFWKEKKLVMCKGLPLVCQPSKGQGFFRC